MTASSLGDSVRVRQVFWFTSPAYNVEKTYEPKPYQNDKSSLYKHLVQ